MQRDDGTRMHAASQHAAALAIRRPPARPARGYNTRCPRPTPQGKDLPSETPGAESEPSQQAAFFTFGALQEDHL